MSTRGIELRIEAHSASPLAVVFMLRFVLAASFPAIHDASGMDPNEKGQTLEWVVRAIEELIVRETSTLRDAPFLLESSKRLVVLGVPLEIDLVATVHRGMPYESVHIFECKNWATSVSMIPQRARQLQPSRNTFTAT